MSGLARMAGPFRLRLATQCARNSVNAIGRDAPKSFTIHPQSRNPRRSYSTTFSFREEAGVTQSAGSVAQRPAPLTVEQYHKLSDAYIDTLLTDFEELQEQDEEVDVEYSAGVLNLRLPEKGTYVINKQPPNKQIWLSSPLSGPKRYDYVSSASVTQKLRESTVNGARDSTAHVEGGEWIYLRDGSSLTNLLKEELGVELKGVE